MYGDWNVMIKVGFIGSRGIPAIYGGFETFIEEVSIGLNNIEDYEVIVVSDAEQREKVNGLESYNGIKLYYSRYKKAKNPILFYFDSMMLAMKHSTLIYSCGTGAGYFAFLPALFGKKFITNPDGIGWQRDKWSPIVKFFLKSLFYFTAKWSRHLVYDSHGIKDFFQNEFNRSKNGVVIEYGAYLNKFIDIETDFTKIILNKYNINKEQYHLVVSRLEPENNVDIIIDGYLKSDRALPLIIVGNLKDTPYDNKLKKSQSDDVRFVGGIYDKDTLEIVRANAFTYLHGHSVGGTNPSLLEAMASKNFCICHDNRFNREVVANNGLFFKDYSEIDKHFTHVENNISSIDYNLHKEGAYNRIKNYYNWENIVKKYNDYFKLISEKG